MKRLVSLAKTYRLSFGAYVLVGGASALVEWATFYAATFVLHIHYIVAALIGFAVATFANFLLSTRAFVKRKDRPVLHTLALIYIVSGIGLGINLAIMIGMSSLLLMPLMLAKIGGTGAAFCWNFLARQFYIFDRKPRLSEVQLTPSSASTPPQ